MIRFSSSLRFRSSRAVSSRGALKRIFSGRTPTLRWWELLLNEKQVTKDAPPTFLWHTYEDNGVKIKNSMLFASALRKNGVPFDLHIFQKGGQGMGLGGGRSGGPVHPWAADCLYWLKAQNFLK